MIDLWQAVLLGIVQGLTEFIPVSSTAHLRIVPALLGYPDPGAAYSAVIQLGTLLSLLIFFRRDVGGFLYAGIEALRERKPAKAYMIWFLMLGTIPISVLGLLFSRYITGEARSLYVIAGSLIGLAILLFVADRFTEKRRTIAQLTWKDALLIGLAQSVALIPGASRSGTTLTMGLVLGFEREAAMRFSFLLSIPAIGLSGLYELFKERHELAHAGFAGLFVATAVSALVGFLAIAGLLRYLKSHTTYVFVAYRVLLGLLILALLAKGSLQP